MDNQSRDQIIIDNLKLVHFTIKKYFPKYYGSTIYEDLVQEGNLELIRCINNYNSLRGTFSNYAITCIRGAINKYLTNNAYFLTSVHVPRRLAREPDGLQKVGSDLSINYTAEGCDGSDSISLVEQIENIEATEDLETIEYSMTLQSFINSIKNENHRKMLEGYLNCRLKDLSVKEWLKSSGYTRQRVYAVIKPYLNQLKEYFSK